ncbi:uncharacterized protein [Bemisia tabaci]|uniref:uncharacterized protein n=1 Tax=Bemisia tabaci TaxID=7038 RepID=UPI003B28C205
MKPKHTRYQISWSLDPALYWAVADTASVHNARCSLCNTSISLSNMGKQALLSHAKGKRHVSAVSAQTLSNSLSNYCKPVSYSTKETVRDSSTGSGETSSVSVTSKEASSVSVTSKEASSVSVPSNNTSSIGPMNLYVSKELVAKAEILTCLNVVKNHVSYRSAGSIVSLDPIKYPDSNIAKQIHLQRTKISYSIVYGLASYFHHNLLKTLQKCSEFTIGFDESLNKVAQKGQMDVNVIYWCADTNEVKTSYYSSAFLQGAKAIDLLEGLISVIESLNLEKVMSVSMDGPNVNIKFLKDFENLILEKNPLAKMLLFIGTCGLHVLNNSFKVGIKATNWKLTSYFSNSYYLFKDKPTRKGLYTQYSGSEIFPKKHCSVRWLENTEVASTAILTLPHIRAFIKGVENDKNEPDSDSYKSVKQFVKDPLLKPKLCFFLSYSSEFKEFLTRFQSDWPLAPFLYRHLHRLLQELLMKFVKPSVIKEADSITKIDLKKQENLLAANKIILSPSTKRALAEIRANEAVRLVRDWLKSYCTLCKISPEKR